MILDIGFSAFFGVISVLYVVGLVRADEREENSTSTVVETSSSLNGKITLLLKMEIRLQVLHVPCLYANVLILLL